ncbi:MAG: response regulator transcription factor [Polyangiales bacterium]
MVDHQQQHFESNGKTILVVEDEPGLSRILGRFLRKHGYHVLSAAGSADAITMSDAHVGAIALLLTDVSLDVMSGRDLAVRISRREGGALVMFMSGFPATIADNYSYLAKPFGLEELLAKVRSVLDDEPQTVRCGPRLARSQPKSFRPAKTSP